MTEPYLHKKHFDEMIEDLNRELRRSPYRMYYKYNGSWEIGLKDGNEIASYILLHIEGNKCVITISRTMMKFKQRHLNTCLRYVAAMIASKEGLPLVSEAISPISLFTMLKLFKCRIRTSKGLVPQGKLTMKECTEMIIQHGHVEVYADTSDYEELVDAAFEAITTIRGGTKNKKVRHGTRRR
jgi:hypothetical protein